MTQTESRPSPLARVLHRLPENPSFAAPLGRLATLRALIHLYGNAIANNEERVAVATVFAQMVQQQQQLIIQLDAVGVALDMRRRNIAPENAPPEIVYRMAEHEVLREEIDLVQQAKAEGSLVSFALRARKRLVAAMVAVIESTQDIPTPDEGWIPSEKEGRRPLPEVTGYMVLMADIGGRREPVVASFTVGALQQLHEQRPTDARAA